MKQTHKSILAFAFAVGACGAAPTAARRGAPPESIDSYLWLEDVLADRSLEWVRERNAETHASLEALPDFETLRTRFTSILDSDARIPMLTKRGELYYNLWRDGVHPRGLLRRTTLTEYRNEQPRWEVVLDVDALATAENENWVWKEIACLPPDHRRCLIALSRGGADAKVIREFDTTTKTFVSGGFEIPEAKTDVGWEDESTIIVATDFGPGTLTSSGYARQVRRWSRGTPLASATMLLECGETDMQAYGGRSFSQGKRHDWIRVRRTFFTDDLYVRSPSASLPTDYTRVEKPADADALIVGDQLIFELRSEWQVAGPYAASAVMTYPSGSLLAIDLAAYLQGSREFNTLFAPSPNRAFLRFVPLASTILVVELEDVHTRIRAHRRTARGWSSEELHADVAGAQNVIAVDDDTSDEYWHTTADFTAPTQYSIANSTGRLTHLKSEPTFFDASGLRVTQHFTQSPDGTRIPYFEIKSDLTTRAQRPAPTLLYGYGGFEISQLPAYNALTGAGWLERGGVYVVANIRGGGEYGPGWHSSGIRHTRERVYEDFIAVAEDLVRRGTTTPAQLGVQGGSNGGLLVGVMLTRRPDLFGAVVCQVPLLDMRRYHRLLAGASWMDEYGNPDVEADWEVISRYSPYQNVRAGVSYPPTLIMTSTRDDRVHPGHARKMTARMRELSQPVAYYENIEGGHGGAANNAQRARMAALAYTFLWNTLRP